MISLIIISGRSGSGKSTALHVLEDMGHYCIDNLPVSLLEPLMLRLSQDQPIERVAVSIDARNIAADLQMFPDIMDKIDPAIVQTKIVYLDAASPALVKRFSETRRRHPLSSETTPLAEAIDKERALLAPISIDASLVLDTTQMTIYELRDAIKQRLLNFNL